MMISSPGTGNRLNPGARITPKTILDPQVRLSWESITPLCGRFVPEIIEKTSSKWTKRLKNKMTNLKCKPQYNSGWWLPFVDVHLVWHQAIHDQCLKVHSRTRCASKIEKKKMKKMSENEYHLDLGREDWYHLKASSRVKTNFSSQGSYLIISAQFQYWNSLA